MASTVIGPVWSLDLWAQALNAKMMVMVAKNDTISTMSYKVTTNMGVTTTHIMPNIL